MRYYDLLSSEQKREFEEINISLSDYLAEFSNDVTISKKIFKNECKIKGYFDFSLQFEDCYFVDTFISNAQFDKRIAFDRCFIEGDLRVEKNVDFNDDFDIINITCRQAFYISDGNYNRCRLSMANESSLTINGGNFKDLYVGFWQPSSFNKISFDFRRVKGNIKVGGASTDVVELSLFQPASEVSIAIEDINVNCISLYRFRNEKGFRVFNIKSKRGILPTEFSITESYLGNAEFYLIDFSSFSNFYLTDTHIVDSSFINVKWKYDIDSFKGRGIYLTEDEKIFPEKIKKLYINSYDIEIRNSPEVIEYFKKNREIYRQLKFALGKQGDVINEQKFHSKEMQAYNMTLFYNKELWTKLIVKASYWFSDYGQSLIKPLRALLIGHFILLFILVLGGNYENLKVSICDFNWAGLEYGTEEYFRLINPLRTTNNDFKGFMIIIDIIMRVWISYMLYNIIRATRRFIK